MSFVSLFIFPSACNSLLTLESGMGFQFHFPFVIKTVTKITDEGMLSEKKDYYFFNINLDLVGDIC